MPNEGSWAVVLPDQTQKNMGMMQMLYQHNLQQERMQEMRQQRELVRQAKAAQFVGENFKDSNYATGTAADPIIAGMTATARQKFAKLIHDNPNMDEGELEMQMQGELSKISQYSAAIKAGRKNIEDGLAHYKDMAGIDVGALKTGAITNMLYQGGDKIVDDPSKINLNRDYLGDELDTRPENYVMGNIPLTTAINAMKPRKGGNTNISEHAGVTTENKYTDEVFPYQEEVSDKNGNVTGLRVRGVPSTLPNGQPVLDPTTRQPVMMADDQTMQEFSKRDVRAQLNRDIKSYVKAHGFKEEDFKPGSDAYNVLYRQLLYQQLNQNTPSEFRTEKKRTNASFVDKMQAGFVDALGRTLGKADAKKEEKLLNGQFGKIRQAANLTPEAMSAATTYQDPTNGKDYLDVTDFVGGFHTDADKKATTYDPGYKHIQKILIDPSDPGKIFTVEGKNGHVQAYDGKALDALLRRYGASNDYENLSDVEKIISKIPIKPNMITARQARAEMELRRRRQQQNAQNAILNPFGQ